MRSIKNILKWILGIGLILAGANHFLNPDFYVRIMPPYLPHHLLLVYLSGAIEIFLGVLLLIPKFQTFAAWGIIALFIAVFPANMHMAMNPDDFPEINPLLLYLRLPIQLILIAWAFWFTKNNAEKYVK